MWQSIEMFMVRPVSTSLQLEKEIALATQTPKFVKRKLDTTDTHCKVGTIPWTAVISGTLGTTSFFPTSSAVSTTSPSAPSTPFRMFPSPSTSALADAALNCLTLLAEDDDGVGWLKGAGVETRPDAEGVGAVAYEGRAGGGMATLEGGRADMMVRFLVVDDELIVWAWACSECCFSV